jgi:hypothetical protein
MLIEPYKSVKLEILFISAKEIVFVKQEHFIQELCMQESGTYSYWNFGGQKSHFLQVRVMCPGNHIDC